MVWVVKLCVLCRFVQIVLLDDDNAFQCRSIREILIRAKLCSLADGDSDRGLMGLEL